MSFTKVAPAGIGTEPGDGYRIGNSFLHSTGLNVSGIITATEGGTVAYYGDGSNLTGIDATAIKHTDGSVKAQAVATGVNVTGNLGVSGVLTYEDVTNIDSVGVVTARSGIKIGPTAGVAGTFFADGSYVTAGIITATSFSGSGANLTNINSTSATGDFSIADKIIHTGDTDTAIRFPVADTITAETGGSERVRIDSSGRLGIQGAPTRALLEVRASGGNNTMLTALWGANEGTTAGTLSDNTDKAVRMGIHHYDTDALPYGLLVGSSTNGVNNLTFGGGTSLMNAATEIKFYTAANSTTATGTERLRIDSSGSVMIGRTSATKPLSVRKLGTSQGVHYIATFGGQNHLAGYAVGIGFDPEGNDNRNKIAIVAEGIGQGYSRGKLHFLLDSANDSGEATLSESRMIINENGQVDIGTQAGPSFSGVNIAATDYPTLRLWDDQKSDNFVLRYHNSTQRVQFINNHQGVYLGRGDTSFGSLSDERAKTIISNITGGLEKIKSLRTIIGKYNDDPESKSRPFLIAQDVQSVLPEAVDARDTDNLGLRYTDMIPLLTNALQESITKIETLEAKVAALEGS